jgi:5-methylcytosine-specific restriction protein A
MSKWPYITSKWKRLRLAKLSECPVCFACEQRGLTELATVVDHMKPISQGGDPFPPLDGLLSLCARCHNEKTSGFDRTHGNANGRRFKGCDANGNPIDPADGWWGHP